MKCRKQLVLTGYRVQFVDLREPKPRTPQEQIHVADNQWLHAMGLTGQNVIANIQEQYERAGYKVFAVEPIKPKRVAEIDLCQLWELVALAATEESFATTSDGGGLPGMKNEKKLFDILSNFEGLSAELEDVNHLLIMYDENLTADFDPLLRGETWGDKHLAGRWPLHQSTLNVIRLRLYAILDEMQASISEWGGALKIKTAAQTK